MSRRAPKSVVPAALIAASADPERVRVNLARLSDLSVVKTRAQAQQLVTVLAHSQALAETLVQHPEWMTDLWAKESQLKAAPTAEYTGVREFRRRAMLRIGARDLCGQATVEETTREIADVADSCLQSVVKIAGRKFSVPGSGFAVIGMGKLGGQELNYSSDVDVIFVYGEEGELAHGVTYHEVFTRLAEEIIRGMNGVFRIDLRLRPEGKSGPLVRSLESCENYYAAWGETWERMALVKARCVAGDEKVGLEFVQMVQPFVYARHAGENVIAQMAALKERIEREVVREGALTRHVKLGVGGIREIEFICQSFQVLRGARVPVLRERNTLRALEALVKTETLTRAEVDTLAGAYRFLRNVEHRLQMEMELQTHTIPDEEQAVWRLARSLGFATTGKFFAEHERQTASVRRIYAGVLAGATPVREGGLSAETLPAELAKAGLVDVEAGLKRVEMLWHGPGFVHVSERTRELFTRLFPLLMKWAGKVAEPDAALARFEKFVGAYGSRGLLYETLTRNPKLVEMWLRVGDASAFLAESLAQQPELFDEIARGGMLGAPKTAARMAEELTDTSVDGVRRWKRAELVRIGVEDVMGLVDLEQTHYELTWLAETCLRAALGKKTTNCAVIAMGKFGGQELGYGADLDVLFVGDGVAAVKQATDVIRFMTQPTAAGTLFAVDARLRPDGEKGTLASSLEAHREYYLKRAQLWERQALTKARFVVGDAALGKKFINMVQDIIYARAVTDGEAKEIRRMRERIEKERGDQELKTGPGGLIDVEFLVQTLQLRHGPQHAPLRTSHTLAALNRLTALGLVEDHHSYTLRRGYLFLRKIESTLRRMDNTSVSKIPSTEREQTILAKRLGFASAEELLQQYHATTRQIRQVWTVYT